MFKLPFSENDTNIKKEPLLISKLSSYIDKILSFNIKPQTILPSQNKKRPVILISPENILFKKYPSLFNYKIAIRPLTGMFLFDLAHNYELISHINGTDFEKEFIYENLDPYGCISYRLNDEDVNINRDPNQIIVIGTENDNLFEKSPKNNIELNPWNGKNDNKIFLIHQFLTNLLYIDPNTWAKTINSFKNLPFFEAYNYIQKKIFHSRNFFFSDYDKFMKNVQNIKMEEYENAKIIMDDQIRKEGILNNWINPIIGFIKTFLI